MVVVVVAGSWLWWLWMWCGCGCGRGVDVVVDVAAVWLPFWVCLGDAACHVINVSTCCPNLYNQGWAGSSVVKRVLIVTAQVGGSNLQNNKCFFAPIKFKLAGGVHLDYMWSPAWVLWD